jgi:hypothetical protein
MRLRGQKRTEFTYSLLPFQSPRGIWPMGVPKQLLIKICVGGYFSKIGPRALRSALNIENFSIYMFFSENELIPIMKFIWNSYEARKFQRSSNLRMLFASMTCKMPRSTFN